MISSPFPDVKVKENNIWELFLKLREHRKDDIAFVDGNFKISFSYSGFCDCVEDVAWNLLQQGFSRKRPVLIYLQSCLEHIIISVAVLKLGGILVLANPLLKTGELLHILNTVSCDIIICNEGNEIFAKEALQTNIVKKLFCKRKGLMSIKQLFEKRQGEVREVNISRRKDTAVILFSSGTTGLPKGVEITQHALLGQMQMWGSSYMDFLPQNCGVLYQPFSHVYGFTVMLNHLALGVKFIVMEKFDLLKYLELVSEFQSDHLYLVPPIAVMLCKSNLEKFDLSCVRNISVGGAPLGKDTAEQLQLAFKYRVSIRQMYGLSEAAGGCLGVSVHLKNYPQGSIGQPFPNVKAKIVDIKTGQDLRAYEHGELCVKCDYFMTGYYKDRISTALSIDSKGWLHTGDISYYDDHGFFFLVDRLKELIKYKGYQVAPAELEDILLSHPEVADVGVVGLPDSNFGEVPHAWIVRRTTSLAEKDLHYFVEDRLAPYKRLRGGLQFVDVIPKSPSGKILRREIKRITLKTKNYVKAKL